MYQPDARIIPLSVTGDRQRKAAVVGLWAARAIRELAEGRINNAARAIQMAELHRYGKI